MTYKHLKSFIESNNTAFTGKIFDLIPKGIKSKIIFAVGNRANESADYLSSVMNGMGIAHSRYIDTASIELKDRFIKNGEYFTIPDLTTLADGIIKSCGKEISSAELCTLLALNLLANGNEYLILEMSDSFYTDLMAKRLKATHAVLLTTFDDSVTVSEAKQIRKPCKHIFAISQKEDYDYISSKTNKNGVKISYVSENKAVLFRSDILGTEFFYNGQEYKISSFDLNNILPASIAVECARAILCCTYPQAYNGLKNTHLSRDIALHSVCPTVLLSERADFKLDKGLKFKTVTEADGIILPTEDTLYIGSFEYLEKIKNAVK